MVYFSLRIPLMSYYGLNCNKLSHIWIWIEEKLYCFSTLFQITSITQGHYWSGVWFAPWFTANKNFLYYPYSKTKMQSSSESWLLLSSSHPVSRVLQDLPPVHAVNASQHFGTAHGLSQEETMLKWTCRSLAELEERIQARFETRFLHTCTSWPCFPRGLQFWA